MIDHLIRCIDCNHTYTLRVNKIDLDRWERGDVDIADVMTYLSPGERELLSSKICSNCFDNLFKMDTDVVFITNGEPSEQ